MTVGLGEVIFRPRPLQKTFDEPRSTNPYRDARFSTGPPPPGARRCTSAHVQWESRRSKKPSAILELLDSEFSTYLVPLMAMSLA